MATLTINGQRVTVDDSFLSLSPDQQNATVDEIAQSLGARQPSQAYQDAAQQMSAITRGMDKGVEGNPVADAQRAQYDAAPEWKKALVATGDVMQTFANGATMGYGPKAAAYARSLTSGKSYDQEHASILDQLQAARNRAGGAATTAEIAGAVATPVKLAGKGVTLAGRFGTAGMTGMKGLAARTALMGAEGSGYGALTAAGNDQDVGTGAIIGLAGGAGGNLLGEGISAGVSKVAGKFNPKVAQPTVAEIKAAGAAAFNRADRAGVVFNKQAVGQLQRNIIDDLTGLAFHPQNEPGAVAALNTLRRIGQGNVTMKGLHAVRRMAQNGYIPGNSSNNAAIGKIVDRIDELINAADPATVLMATKNPKAAAAAFNEGKAHWHRAMKLETVEKAILRGEQNANAQVSGDVGRTTMGQLKKVLQSEARTRGFTSAEMKALGNAAGYSTGQRLAHAVGGLMPRGRLLSSIHGALALGTGGASIPMQAAGATVGYAAQKTAESIARKSVAELTSLIANGGVPAPVMKNAIQLLSEAKREGLSRALMAIGVNRGNAWYNEPRHQEQP